MSYSTRFQSYGTAVRLVSNDREILSRATAQAYASLLENVSPIRKGPYEVTFEFFLHGAKLALVRNKDPWGGPTEDLDIVFKSFDNLLRISVAEYAKGLVFLHAGAVGINGKAIVLPGQSFKGKSTLVTELVRAGAEYYSDDFAILDEEGLVHAYPRPISLRAIDGRHMPTELDHEEVGKGPSGPIPVGMILLTEYRRRAKWRPEVLSPGAGVLATVPFSLQVQRDPRLCLNVLNKVALSARIATTPRGEAKQAAKRLLTLFDNVQK
jgi:hypothetical protein